MKPFLGLIALALAVPLLAQDQEDQEDEVTVIEEEIPSDPAGRLSRDVRDQPALFVRLGAEGALEVKRGEVWKATSLKDLGLALAEELQRRGEAGYERLESGLKVSKLFVSIEADPSAPWQHLQWLMIEAAKQKYYKLELSDGKRRMLTYLPCDRGLPPKAEKPPQEIRVSIHLMARMEQARKWNDKTVSAPTTVLYRFGDRDTEELATLAGWIADAKKAVEPERKKGASLVGEIKAGLRVPFARVFDVMELLLDADLPAVSFYGTTPLPDETRALTVLPYPVRNY